MGFKVYSCFFQNKVKRVLTVYFNNFRRFGLQYSKTLFYVIVI